MYDTKEELPKIDAQVAILKSEIASLQSQLNSLLSIRAIYASEWPSMGSMVDDLMNNMQILPQSFCHLNMSLSMKKRRWLHDNPTTKVFLFGPPKEGLYINRRIPGSKEERKAVTDAIGFLKTTRNPSAWLPSNKQPETLALLPHDLAAK